MLFKLFLLFTVTPIIELWLIIKIGQRIGALDTVALLLISGALGAWFARQQGLKTLKEFFMATQAGQVPASQLLDGALIILGGALMVAPGFMTDIFGLFLVIPWTRALIRPLFLRWVTRQMKGAVFVSHGPGQFHFTGFPGDHKPGGKPEDDNVIDV
ncbi:MAG: FxsA family protein [Nitrospinae bacterium]|nr:FxsA family protein [Nitrospinota bacterium]